MYWEAYREAASYMHSRSFGGTRMLDWFVCLRSTRSSWLAQMRHARATIQNARLYRVCVRYNSDAPKRSKISRGSAAGVVRISNTCRT